MKIEIRNYRGVTLADIEHNKYTLIAGHNHQGKTSIKEAVAAALTTRPLVIDITKSQVKNLIRDGAKRGQVKIEFTVPAGPGSLFVEWPECKFSAGGQAMKPISQIAGGLTSLLDMKKPDRAAALAGVVNLDPTPEDLITEMKSQNFQEETIKTLVQQIKINGIETMYLRAKEAGARIKGQWQEVTGTDYGSNIAENWYPAAYYSALESRSEEELQKEIDACMKDVEAGVAARAISDMEFHQQKRQAELKPEIEKYLSMLAGSLDVLRAEESTLQKALLDATAKNSEVEYGCPHCGGAFFIRNGKPVISDPDKQSNNSEQAAADIRIKLEAVRKKLNALLVDISAKQNEWKQAAAAADTISKLPPGTRPGVSEEEVTEARIKLEKAKADLKAWQDLKRSRELKALIDQNKLIVEMLAPAGIRNTVAARALNPFNALLMELSTAAGWEPVRVDRDYNLFHGDRLAALCSTEEVFETNIILQLAIAKLEGAATVLIDGADIIVHPKDRNGLFMAIIKSGVPAMVFMGIKDPAEVPNLSTIGGRSYWIEKGELKNAKSN